jgi:hypothetical protein
MKAKSPASCRAAITIGVAVVALLLGSTAAYAANPVPTVTAPVQPQAVVPGHPDFVLTVYGANFVSGAVVNWNGSPRSTLFVSARELQAKILASDVAKPTAGFITVTNPRPGGGKSSSSYAVVEVHIPTKTIVPATPHYYDLGGLIIFFATVADFNGDGKLDVLAGGSDTVYLFSGKGDGTFSYTVVGRGYYNNFGCGHAFGDFNNDGKLDYVFSAGVFSSPSRAEVRLGNGKGGFRTSGKFGTFQECGVFVAGDFNGDGNLDFAVASLIDSEVFIFLGKGDGTFNQGATYHASGAFGLVTADFNGDGKLDLVVDINRCKSSCIVSNNRA